MQRVIIGMTVGMVAGIIDVIPMIILQLPLDANISAFTMWACVGIVLSIIDVRVHSMAKGVIAAFLLLAPCAVLIAAKEPTSLIPIVIMTTMLGCFCGFAVDFFVKKFLRTH